MKKDRISDEVLYEIMPRCDKQWLAGIEPIELENTSMLEENLMRQIDEYEEKRQRNAQKKMRMYFKVAVVLFAVVVLGFTTPVKAAVTRFVSWTKTLGVQGTDVYTYHAEDASATFAPLKIDYIPDGFSLVNHDDEYIDWVDEYEYRRKTAQGEEYLFLEKMKIEDGMTSAVNNEWDDVDTIKVNGESVQVHYQYSEEDEWMTMFVRWIDNTDYYFIQYELENCSGKEDSRVSLREMKRIAEGLD
jgi:hypothetical protein